MNLRILVFASLLLSGPALAGGYDTPMLYTAEHMGGGGAAVAGVDDPSALFHNPAGLARTGTFSGIADLSYLSGWIKGSPGAADAGRSIQSEQTEAPFFLLGVAGALTDKISAGMGFYPIASAGGAYEHKIAGNPALDSTKLVFLELSPGLAMKLPGRVNLGLGYRYTIMTLTRKTEPEGVDPTTDFELSGNHAAGFRAGLQWTAMEEKTGPLGLELGLSYRHRVIIPVSAPEGTAVFKFKDITSTFTLPSRLILGLKAKRSGYHLNLDLEHGFNSQNQESELRGMQLNPTTGEEIAELGVKNIFAWQDSQTLRVGAELPIPKTDRKFVARVGYVHDGVTSSKVYPTAFGTPPAVTQVITAGLGWRPKNMKVDLAYAHRSGQATVSQEDVNQRTEACLFCSYPGDYEISLSGLYASFVYRLP